MFARRLIVAASIATGLGVGVGAAAEAAPAPSHAQGAAEPNRSGTAGLGAIPSPHFLSSARRLG